MGENWSRRKLVTAFIRSASVKTLNKAIMSISLGNSANTQLKSFQQHQRLPQPLLQMLFKLRTTVRSQPPSPPVALGSASRRHATARGSSLETTAKLILPIQVS